MVHKSVKVSFRDKSTGSNVELGVLELDLPETLAEVTEQFEEKDIVEYVVSAFVIQQQGEYRAAHRPDRPKGQSILAKFKALPIEMQEQLLAKTENAA